MKLRYSAAARDELAEAMLWYERERQGLGARLREEVRRVLASVQQAPLAAAEIAPGVRRKLLHRFPYSVVYRMAQERIDVIAIAHHRRLPVYWHERR